MAQETESALTFLSCLVDIQYTSLEYAAKLVITYIIYALFSL